MLYINDFPAPLLNSCNCSHPSTLRILITVPFAESDAIKVPCELTVKASISD